jgi:plasmid stabilization system protein ParE
MGERRFVVKWTEAAVLDLEGIAGFIASESPMNAERLLDRLEARAASLTTSPWRGRVVPELSQCGLYLWRELVVAPYRIVFRVEKSRVYVLAVLNSREMEDLLLERLVRMPGPR